MLLKCVVKTCINWREISAVILNSRNTTLGKAVLLCVSDFCQGMYEYMCRWLRQPGVTWMYRQLAILQWGESLSVAPFTERVELLLRICRSVPIDGCLELLHVLIQASQSPRRRTVYFQSNYISTTVNVFIVTPCINYIQCFIIQITPSVI